MSSAFVPITTESADLHRANFHFIAENNIYAFLGQRICRWDGTTWTPITQESADLVASSFHYVADDEIYAVLGQKICRWNGTA